MQKTCMDQQFAFVLILLTCGIPRVKDALEANRCNISSCWLAHPCSMDALQASGIWSQKYVFAGPFWAVPASSSKHFVSSDASGFAFGPSVHKHLIHNFATSPWSLGTWPPCSPFGFTSHFDLAFLPESWCFVGTCGISYHFKHGASRALGSLASDSRGPIWARYQRKTPTLKPFW